MFVKENGKVRVAGKESFVLVSLVGFGDGVYLRVRVVLGFV